MDQIDKPDVTGELRRSPIVQVFWDMIARRFSGSLVLRAGAEAGALHGDTTLTFIDGRNTQTRMPQPIDTLGEVLQAQGVITREQCDASLVRLARQEGLQGEILVSLGACTIQQVEGALVEQLRRKFVRLFALVHGQFALYINKDLLLDFGAERYPVDVMPWLWVGARSYPRHPAVDAAMGLFGTHTVRLRATARPELFHTDDDARMMLDEVALGVRADEMLARHPPLLVRPFLYMLAMARQLELAASASPSSPPEPQRLSAVDLASMPGRTSQLPMLHASPPEAFAERTSDASPRRSSSNKTAAIDLGAVVAEARARLEALEGQTAFEMLGVPRDATGVQIAAGFRASSQRWRPGSAANPEIREVYETITATLAEAEATLTDPRLREAYLRDLAAGFGTPRTRRERARRQNTLARAEGALRQRDFAEAERAARELVAQDGEDLNAKLLLASAIIEVRPTGPFDEVRKIMVAVLEKEPENDRALVIVGMMFRRMGDERRSAMQYLKAYKANPRNVDAGRELRLVVMRRREATSTSTIEPDLIAAISRALKI